MKNWVKKSIVSILIIIFAFTPVFGVLQVKMLEAQVQGGYTTGNGYGTAYSGGGIRGYISGLAPTIVQLPQCKEVISKKMKSLFRGMADLLKGKQQKLVQSITDKANQAASDNLSIPIHLAQEEKELLRQGLEAQRKIDAQTESLQESLCLDAIGRLVIKVLLQKITMATVQWIQGGFHGGPAFIQNPGRFFKEIAEEEILVFAGEIRDINPYSAAWLQAQAEAFNRKFQDNATYSLNEMIQSTTPQYTDMSFSTDFGAGGWAAWTYLTQVPANNPIGFQVIASGELSKRLDGVFQSNARETREALSQASGYLGDYRCANPKGLPKEQHMEALRTNNIAGTCKRWEYVTPGKMIAESATKIVNYQDNNLLDAEDLNDAVAAILDALLARFSSDLMNKGFADFPKVGSDGSFQFNGDEMTSGGFITQTEKDFPKHHLASNWLKENPDFDIRQDLTQALIDEQRTYVQKLEDQNVAAKKLMKSIYQLDYCIPGPNPKWEETSSVEEFFNTVKVSPAEGMPVVGQLALSSLSIIGTALAGPIGGAVGGLLSGVADAIFENKEERQLKERLALVIQKALGVHIYGGHPSIDDGEQDQVVDESGIRDLIEGVFDSYRNVIYQVYFASQPAAPMPGVTAQARKEFNNIEGYQEMLRDNLNLINTKNGIIARLDQIKDEVDSLKTQYNIGPDYNSDFPNNAFESALQPWTYYFGRISRDLVSGDDVAEADNLRLELIDKDNYVFNELLQGPGGCEQELNALLTTNPKEYDKFVRRQPYPIEIYYFYGNPPSNPGGGGNDPNNPPPASTTKYFGNIPVSGNGGTWIGDNGQGTWWTGSGGNGVMIMGNIGGSGSFTGSNGSGTWIGQCTTGNCAPGSQSTWYGSGGDGLYLIQTCNGTTCSGTWSGGNGSGSMGGGYAPNSGIWIGDLGGGGQSISGTWTMTSGNPASGPWSGTLFPGGIAVGSWFGGSSQQGNIGDWKPGSPPTGNNDPEPEPEIETMGWDPSLIPNWDPNQGFLYGSIFWNPWAASPVKDPKKGPYGLGYDKNGNISDQPGAKPKFSEVSQICPDHFISIVELSLPSPFEKDGDTNMADIGGLEAWGNNGSWGETPGTGNTCGVITRRFEKIFNIY